MWLLGSLKVTKRFRMMHYPRFLAECPKNLGWKFRKKRWNNFSRISHRGFPHILPKISRAISTLFESTRPPLGNSGVISLKTWMIAEFYYAFFTFEPKSIDGKYEFSQRDLILDHLKRSKVTHLKVCLKLDLSFVSLKYIRFRQRLIWLCLRTVLPLLIQLFTWIKMSRYTDSKRKHQNTKNKPNFIQIKNIWSLN